MIKDLFPVRVLFRPNETFAAIAAGKIGWLRPLALYCASAAASAFMLCSLPPEFLAEATSGVKLAAGRGFLWHLSVGLPGGLGFTLFFCALLAAFLSYIKAGSLPARLACLVLGTAAYGFFFLLPLKGSAAYILATRLLAALAAAFAVWTAVRHRQCYARLAKAVLGLSVITLASDAAGAAAALAGSVSAFNACQFFFAALALAYTVKAAASFFGTSTARAAAAVVTAMLAAAAFLFSLSSLGLLSPEIFQALLLI